MWKNSLILVSCKLFSNDKKMSKTLQDFTKMKKKITMLLRTIL